jgi:hypothetical protein
MSQTDKNEIIDTLKNKYSGKRYYNTFIPAFIIGAMIARGAKYHLAEPAFASISI